MNGASLSSPRPVSPEMLMFGTPQSRGLPDGMLMPTVLTTLSTPARGDVAVLQVAEPEARVVQLVGAERPRVAEDHLMHVGVGVATHVGDRERVVAELVRDTVAEHP